MTNREKVIAAYECSNEKLPDKRCEKCPFGYEYLDQTGDTYFVGCNTERMMVDAIDLLRAQEPREITKEEWEQWKKTPDGKRDPLYFMWVDCAPGLWITSHERINEVAYLTGEIKIWNKKPSYDVMMKIQQDTWTQQGK